MFPQGPTPSELRELQRILESACRMDMAVSSELLPLVYHELRNVAATYMSREAGGQTLQPTALVHEAWLRLTKDQGLKWNDRAHFFRTAAQVMRRILVDRARAKASSKRGGHAPMIDVYDLDPAEATKEERVLLIDEMLDRLEEENPDSARVVSLRFFGGLTEKEIALMDNVTERTVRRRWSYARTRLFQMLREENDPTSSP